MERKGVDGGLRGIDMGEEAGRRTGGWVGSVRRGVFDTLFRPAAKWLPLLERRRERAAYRPPTSLRRTSPYSVLRKIIAEKGLGCHGQVGRGDHQRLQSLRGSRYFENLALILEESARSL